MKHIFSSGLKIGFLIALLKTIWDVLKFPASYQAAQYLAYGFGAFVVNLVIFVIAAIIILYIVRLARKAV